jgi:hypothetical protein
VKPRPHHVFDCPVAILPEERLALIPETVNERRLRRLPLHPCPRVELAGRTTDHELGSYAITQSLDRGPTHAIASGERILSEAPHIIWLLEQVDTVARSTCSPAALA